MAAGIYGQTDFNVAWHGVASLEYGFSVYHIIESTQSFLSEHGSASSEENLLNRRYSGYVSYAHPFALGNQINTVLSPYVMVDVQSVMRNLQFGVCWEEERFGLIGLGVRGDQFEGLQVGTLLVHLGVNIPEDVIPDGRSVIPVKSRPIKGRCIKIPVILYRCIGITG